MTPKFSIIINCYNGEKYLKEAIDSAYAQTFHDWEIIFFDNASTDGTAEIANSYDSKLKYFLNDHTVPLGEARNLAVAKTSGEYIAFLDADDLWEPEKLEIQSKLFADKKVGIAYSDALYFNESGYAKPQHGGRPQPEGKAFEKLLYSYSITLSSAAVRMTALDRLDKMFDPSFSVTEETDLFIRISRDWSIAYSPKILCGYRMHGENASFKNLLAFPTESEQSYRNYKEMYPDFAEKHYDKLMEEVNRAYALAEWKMGNRLLAIKRVLPVAFANRKCFFTFLLMLFLPYPWFSSLRAKISNRGFINS